MMRIPKGRKQSFRKALQVGSMRTLATLAKIVPEWAVLEAEIIGLGLRPSLSKCREFSLKCSRCDAIASCLFSGIESPVGGNHDLIAAGAVGWVFSQAAADGHRPGHPGINMSLNPAAQLLRYAHSVLPGGFRHHNRELVPAVAAHQVHLAQLLSQDGGNGAQNFIAQEMSELVIQPLEVVDVDHDDRDPALEARSALELLDDSHFEKPAVVDSREPIDIGELFHTVKVIGVLDSGGANIGDGFQRPLVVRIESVLLRAVQRDHA